jgi:hypothetical protein
MHTLAHPAVFSLPEWRRFIADLSQVVNAINRNGPTDRFKLDNLVIFGQYGSGAPTFSDEMIVLNGNCRSHRWYKAHRTLRVPEGEQDDAHEDFTLSRVRPAGINGYCLNCTDTSGKQYALAVRAAFILARHYFPSETAIVQANATEEDWHVALGYARHVIPTIVLPSECDRLSRERT